jgi:hypothetical protein
MVSEPSDGSMEVWLFPYLPLELRLDIGPWELIPREQLAAADATNEAMVKHAHDVAALYRMPRGGRRAGASGDAPSTGLPWSLNNSSG